MLTDLDSVNFVLPPLKIFSGYATVLMYRASDFEIIILDVSLLSPSRTAVMMKLFHQVILVGL